MTAIIEPALGNIIKSDRTGRTRYTQQYKQEVLDAFESSSLSGPAFAQHCGIKYSTFAAWIARRKHMARPELATESVFLLAEVAEASGASDSPGLEVDLPGGAHTRATDSKQIALLAELLTRLA